MTLVSYDPAARLWLLSTAGSSYAIRLDEDDVLRQVHWGRPLTLEQALTAAAVPAAAPGSSFDGITGEEYPAEGGARFGLPSLQLRHADGSRGVHWQYLGHGIETGAAAPEASPAVGEEGTRPCELTIRFRDRHYPLELDLHYRLRPSSEVLERRAVLRHTESESEPWGEPVRLLRMDAACWTLPPLPDYRLSHVTGGWSSEGRLRRTSIPVAETVLTSRRGITSHQANPWLMLDDGSATEDSGEVWSTALAWSGSWRITVQRAPEGVVSCTGGSGHEGLVVRLLPGDSWETPVFAGQYAQDGFGGASRAWHRHIADHVLPRAAELRPVLYNSWEATGFRVSEQNQLQLAAKAAELGVELFVMDDGWFGARRDDTAGLGDWTPSAEAFPDGLGPLVAEVRRLGMRFGLWVEPEMVNPDSDLYREHPDWVLRQPHRERSTLRNQLVLDLARPEVAAWAHARLDALVSEYAVNYLKWDMNRPFTDAGRPGHPDPDRLWFDHVHAVHALMARLRSDHPGLRIEACAGGGGRVDLGVLAHADSAWTSDNTDALDRIGIQHGYSQLYPARTMSAWVTDSPNPLTGRSLPLAFRFHVAMAGALGIGGDLRSWTEAELRQAADLVARYKRIRPVVQQGAQYRHRNAVQHVLGEESVLIAWQLPVPHGVPIPPLRLAALDPAARYRDQETGRLHEGALLLARGLDVRLDLGLTGDFSSTVVHLRREGG
ncbi:alpha-galactosidase [Streptacidiphilus albus]|uniref:alpha-galactosidase n=1 Tax=Streptacidiphilus albus TaxID=105425 RepID=UPI00054B6B46|nr:alpha-galactosidase [Streptacidiphilus albus]